MIPRDELSELLEQRLHAVLSEKKIEELLSDIEKLETGWEEVNVAHREMGYSMSVNCPDICWLADQIDRGEKVRIYIKKHL